MSAENTYGYLDKHHPGKPTYKQTLNPGKAKGTTLNPSKVMKGKHCYCHNCKKEFHHLGIMSHRAMHRRKKEDCKITFTDGNTRKYNYTQVKQSKSIL